LSDAAKAKVNERLAEKELPAFTELLTKAKAVKADLDATEPTEPSGGQEKPDNQIVLYAAIGAGVVLLLAIVLIVLKKKRK
jgi:LPXTG-motif cell wall-anchored protein